MERLNKEAIKLIDRLYKDLYLDEQVLHHGIGNKYDKFNNIESYINKLENIHERASKDDRYVKNLKKLYYDKYVIKREDIPESYYKHQQEIAFERGYGYVEITEDQKQQLQDEIINNQKASIDIWLDYFLSEDAKVYPFWAKYWAFQGMLKLGTYDKEKQIFNKRYKNTIAPFSDLNREALAMSIDLMIKILNKEELEDKELENLVKTGSFQKIYSHIITNTLKDNKDIKKANIGRWVKYEQGSDHIPLVNSLKGYNTGWCTAGESTAKSQLQGGDFYVYYTLDENNEYKVPRIAIRMEYGKIGEIRGIATDQNMEPEMEEVLEEKLKEFPDKEQYYKKVSDMKKLTYIYKKHKNKQELSPEELMFLYEIKEEVTGFGYEKDLRIEEIKNKRNLRQDLSIAFNCRENQIALIQEEINEETIYYDGDLDLRELRSAEGLVLPQILGGNLYLNSLTSAKNLKLPQIICGNLDLSSLTSAEGLVLPQIINGDLNLSSLTSTKGLVLPQQIRYSLDLSSLKNAKGLSLPQTIGWSLFLDELICAEDLVLPQKVRESLYLSSLTSTKGLIIPELLTYEIQMKGFKITPENLNEYRTTKSK